MEPRRRLGRVAFDGDTPGFTGGDSLSLADLDGALARALAETNTSRLDVVGFDACLMAQLDVLRAVQPYAGYAVASQELTLGLGWNYRSLLRRLYDNPQVDGAAVARQMVADFAEHYSQVEPDDFVTMAAVDPARLQALAYAVEALVASRRPSSLRETLWAPPK